MKKFRVFLILIMCLCVLFTLTACAMTAKIKLATPIGVRVNYDKLLLTWVSVNDATTYEIAIAGEPVEQVNKTSWDLSSFAPGTYELTVRAIGDGKQTKNSNWSESVSFIRETEPGLKFQLYNNSAEYMVTGVEKTAGENIVIPDYYRQKPVTKIAKGAFSGETSIKTVVVGENVTVIEDKAFDNCSFMESIEFLAPEMQSIGANAFQRCWALKEITIPKGIKTINQYTFNYCRALESVTFNDDLYIIDAYAFDSCAALTEINLPDSVVYIGEYAFNNCKELQTVNFGKNLLQLGQRSFAVCKKLVNVNFPEDCKLQVVDQYAFTECEALVEIKMPDSLLAMGHAVFSFCTNFEKIELGDNVQQIGAYILLGTKLQTEDEDGVVYADNWLVYCMDQKLAQIEFAEGTVGIANQAFENCTGLKIVVMPDTIKYMGAYAFENCTGLMSVTLSENLKDIPAYAFNNCASLMSVQFGSNVKTIGRYAFYKCGDLNTILLPDTVEKVGSYAFRQTGLWVNSTPGDYVYVGNWVVGFKPALTNVLPETIKVGTIGIADAAFYDMDAGYITMPNSIVYIGEYSFYRVSMKYLKVSEAAKKIGDYAFFQCTEMQTLSIPEGVEEIGRSAFYQIQTTEISLPQSVKTIGMYAFYRPAQLQTLNLGGAETIGKAAFYNAVVLENLTIPSNVKTIEDYAFYGCIMLSSVEIQNGVEYIGDYAFAKAVALTSLKLPNSVKVLGKYAFRDMAMCTTLVLSSNLQQVGDGAFMNCAVEHLVVSGDNAVFDKYTFRGCANLKTVVVSNTVSSVGQHAFYGCKQATFFIENGTDMTAWNSRWNSSRGPVVSGVTLSEDKTYVESFVKNQDNVVVDIGKIANDPVKAGYTFAGWATTSDGEVKYSMADIKDVPDGTVLYAKWTLTQKA